MFGLSRDGALLWFLVAAALVGYLLSVGVPPNEWDYKQWLQFGAAFFAWGVGKLQSSPAPSVAENKTGFRDSGEKLAMLLAVGLLSMMLLGCATGGAGSRPPDVAAAQVGTDVLKAATTLQNEVNRLTAATVMPIPIGQQITDANKIVSEKSGQLSTALKAYHAATSLADRTSTAATAQALITELSEPLSRMLGVKLPEGAAQSVSRLIGAVMSAVGAIQAEIAKGLSAALWRLQPAFA